MPNVLGIYNPLFYANEALILVYKQLGMASRVYMRFDEERKAFGLGDTINIRKPGSFTVQNAPSTKQDLNPETVSFKITEWKEVKFAITDKEFAFTKERIIEDHIEPAAYAIADHIDQFTVALTQKIPWVAAVGAQPGSAGVNDILTPQRVMFDNKVPLQLGRIHYMINGAMQQGFLGMQAFSQYQGAGPEGAAVQRTGHIGFKYNTEIFANQNTPSRTTGTTSIASSGVSALALNDATALKGDTTISIDAAGAAVTGTLRKGDTFVIAGNTQRYVVLADVTAAANNFANVSIFPALVQNHADNDVITVTHGSAVNVTNYEPCMFHRNAFALAFAPLSMMGNKMGAQVATVQDPITGLALRSRMWYEADSSEIRVALDVLFGGDVLDPNLAVRAYHTLS